MPFPVMPPPRAPRRQRLEEALASTGFILLGEEWSRRYDTGKLFLRSPEGYAMVVEASGDVIGRPVAGVDSFLADDLSRAKCERYHGDVLRAVENAILHPSPEVSALYRRDERLWVWNVYSEVKIHDRWEVLRTCNEQSLQAATMYLLGFAALPDWRRSYLAHRSDPTAATEVPLGAIHHAVWDEKEFV